MKLTYLAYGADDAHRELADQVFSVEGRHRLVEGVLCKMCARCREQLFRRETAERIRLVLRSETRPTRSVSMQVYEFVA